MATLLKTRSPVRDLDLHTLSKLRKLAKVNIDTANSFDHAARMCPDPKLRDMLNEISLTRELNARAINQILDAAAYPKTSYGTIEGFAMRWMAAVRVFFRNARLSVALDELKRADARLLARYEQLLPELLGTKAHDEVTRQSHLLHRDKQRIAMIQQTASNWRA